VRTTVTTCDSCGSQQGNDSGLWVEIKNAKRPISGNTQHLDFCDPKCASNWFSWQWETREDYLAT
jgi:hypothetical protein